MNNLLPLNKGWSSDEKFIEEREDGSLYLLRTSPISRLKHRQSMFEAMNVLYDKGVKLCKPISINTNTHQVSLRFQWLIGKDLRDCIKDLPIDKRIGYGYEAGRILKQIHALPAPDDLASWDVRFGAKIKKKLDEYQTSCVSFNESKTLFEYIDAARHLLLERPTTFQHGDYHCGNMMLVEDALHIIDFDRFDYGDPWEEFNRIVWCVDSDPLFASAILDAYFDFQIPKEFWELLRLYISVNTLSSLSWALKFGDDEVETMKHQANDVIRWYEASYDAIPSWYQCTQ